MTTGLCRICGKYTQLTHEHLIPRAAGNTGRRSVHTIASLSKRWAAGEIYQTGLKRETVCGKCNSEAGQEYVPAFARWTSQAHEYYERVPDDACPLLPFAITPLRVAKQLAVLTLAMSEPASVQLPHFAHLRRLVREPRRSEFIPGFLFYTYFHVGAPALDGPMAPVDFTGGPSPMTFCQVGIEPLGYIVTADDPASAAWATRLGLCDISRFFHRQLNEV